MKNIVVFSSGGPGNFRTTYKFCRQYSEVVRLVGLVTDRDNIPSIEYADKNNIPARVFPFSSSVDTQNEASVSVRGSECNVVLEYLLGIEKELGRIDLIVLGFRRILVGDILQEFCGRIINVHPADLSVYDPKSRQRKYCGISGLESSLRDGIGESRTSIHYVNEGVDQGEIICLGPRVTYVSQGYSKASIWSHEARQKIESDRVALTRALKVLLIEEQVTLPIVM